jgi:transcriptional regulator with XRE-family HTH domain
MLPEEIKQKRLALNLTQEELAEKFGVERNTVARWERGAIVPQAKGMLSLAFQTLEIEKKLQTAGIEALLDSQSKKINRLRIRHAKNKAEFLEIEKKWKTNS